MADEVNVLLLVEDNEDHAEVIETTLRLSGLANQVVWARDGEEALGHLDAGELQPVLILLDLKLPRIDGFEVLRRVRASTTWREVPVLVLTSSDRPEDVSRSRELGADGYLDKLLAPTELVERVRAFLTIPSGR